MTCEIILFAISTISADLNVFLSKQPDRRKQNAPTYDCSLQQVSKPILQAQNFSDTESCDGPQETSLWFGLWATSRGLRTPVLGQQQTLANVKRQITCLLSADEKEQTVVCEVKSTEYSALLDINESNLQRINGGLTQSSSQWPGCKTLTDVQFSVGSTFDATLYLSHTFKCSQCTNSH